MLAKIGTTLMIAMIGIFSSYGASAYFNSGKVLIVSPEQTRIFQTGGLSHATTGLAKALRQAGISSVVLMPWYTEMQSGPIQDTGERFYVDLDWRQGVSYQKSEFSLQMGLDTSNPTVYLQHENKGALPNYFDSRPSVNGGKKAYGPDFRIGESFAAFAKAAADYAILHEYEYIILNDWTAALTAVYLEEARRAGKKVPKVIFAIHNMAYQGVFPKTLADYLGLPERYFSIDGYEFYGQMNFLKAGLQFSDMIYTVSPQYASEITTKRFGAGLEGVIQEKAEHGRVTGILNGIINEDWDPSKATPDLAHTFSSSDLSGKEAGKKQLLSEVQLPNHDLPLFVLTSRMAEQKGFEYLIESIEKVVSLGQSNWIVIGDGDEKYIEQFKQLQEKYPSRLKYQRFSNLMEQKMTRYADFFVNGAWFEPSGLNQFFALKNGTVPVVSASGGLLNSVEHKVTGFHFDVIPGRNGEVYDREATVLSAERAIQQAIEVYRDKSAFRNMQKSGMAQDNSWSSRVELEFKSLFKYVDGLTSGSLLPSRSDQSSGRIGVRSIEQLLKLQQPGQNRCKKVYL